MVHAVSFQRSRLKDTVHDNVGVSNDPFSTLLSAPQTFLNEFVEDDSYEFLPFLVLLKRSTLSRPKSHVMRFLPFLVLLKHVLMDLYAPIHERFLPFLVFLKHLQESQPMTMHVEVSTLLSVPQTCIITSDPSQVVAFLPFLVLLKRSRPRMDPCKLVICFYPS